MFAQRGVDRNMFSDMVLKVLLGSYRGIKQHEVSIKDINWFCLILELMKYRADFDTRLLLIAQLYRLCFSAEYNIVFVFKKKKMLKKMNIVTWSAIFLSGSVWQKVLNQCWLSISLSVHKWLGVFDKHWYVWEFAQVSGFL